ncbi:glycosyl hydrolase family 28 protein [Ferruginibacter sp. SUN106]|uniref:glycosyl hydrolase family 28 protein n=1 Tax=Ferruginibacter sp. SUN106 TaxID=2978348 RepID=UPI003D3639D2
MKKYQFLLVVALIITADAFALSPNKYNLLIAPGTLTENAVTLLWDKQYNAGNVEYEVLLNGKLSGTAAKTNFTITNLLPNTSYTVSLRLKNDKGNVKQLYAVKFKTAAKGKIYNILDYGAKDDTAFKNTTAIQKAINACTTGGTVYIPKGTFVSGALYLKSNMTLYIEKGATLKGAVDVEDYLPMYLNRFEGWELKTYASLLNAGTLNRNGTYNVKNLRITGGGTISGGGKKLGNAMWTTGGERSRGRLICLVNCQDVCISDLTITEPSSWTIHYIYSDNITCHNLDIITYGIRNGDGIDPDSSTGSYIFNCSFDNGDDCIAIKSGKNPEGFYVGKPTKNVRITDCDFIRGHGISIGSEMSGGVSDVLVQDCKAGALINGLQIKGTKERGGYVRNVTVVDCQLLKITVFSKLNYNNDGEGAPEPPIFENFIFKNIDLSKASVKEPVININGFNDPAHRLRNVSFSNILLPDSAKVIINDAEKINFTGVKSASGAKPEYVITNGTEIIY